ncbi:hypothetical protein LWI29_030552 [Acer saccharum]|uniref:Disease resistance R13L4/SHOC-2-like LRR domain-containing protein n=1 Tax=Acer saccharum TaxID=4024 RepID=A0AA39T4Q4_ACESA|nr:hypothetical protein LWI29_030552 [Acer saccharum]
MASQPNASENLTIQGLIETISNLHNNLSEAMLFFPAASIQENYQNVNQGDDKEKDEGDSSKWDLGNCFQSSLPARLRDKTRKEKSRIKEEEKNENDGSTNSSNNQNSDCFQAINPLKKLCNDLNYMKSALTKLKAFEDDLSKPIETLKCSIENLRLKNILQTQASNGSIQTEQIQPKLHEIRKELFNLKIKISSLHIISSTNLMQIVFPEDAVIEEAAGTLVERRLLLDEEKTVEDSAHEILEDFVMKGFIKPVNRKYRMVANSFKMHTFVHSAVIMLAKEAGFFDYNPEGNPTSNFFSCDRACLVNAQWLETEKLDKLKTENLDKLKTLFNVSNRFPDFTLEWFSKMRRLRVLYLGRWQSSLYLERLQSSEEKCHIEVESTEFLKGLKYMEGLRLLSLHGISGIRELPSSISRLRSLRILDLRACYNLENLPKQVGSLKMLTNLDISECYLLDYMPKELLSLSELQVLKGFVITDAKHGSFCTLAELAGLEKLQKLSINVNSVAFSLEEIFATLQKFEALLKLQVAWGGESLQAKPNKNSKEVRGEARNKGDEGDQKEGEECSKVNNQEKNTEGQSRMTRQQDQTRQTTVKITKSQKEVQLKQVLLNGVRPCSKDQLRLNKRIKDFLRN